MRRAVRLAIISVLVLALVPMSLAVIYRVVNPVSTLMLARWAVGATVQRTWVPLGAMAPSLPRTVIAAEDARFCSHWGIDFVELRAAYEEAEDLSDARGGSTLTQQTVKNLFLWPGRSYLRKVLELPLALWLDLVLPKARILEIYLNIAEWGPGGIFGAEAAARSAFGKSARDLSRRESAILASVLPNPVARSARRPGRGVQRLAGTYQARAAATDAGCLGPGQ